MSPCAQSWQNHIRALTSAIALRGTTHTYSVTNLRLISTARLLVVCLQIPYILGLGTWLTTLRQTLQELSTRQPGSLSSDDWESCTPIRLVWLATADAAMNPSKELVSTCKHELYASVESFMAEAAAAVAIMAKYDQLVANMSKEASENDFDLSYTLLNLYHEAESILRHTEPTRLWWEATESEISMAAWSSIHPDATTDTTSDSGFLFTTHKEALSLFDTVLSFPSLEEYQAISLYWAITMALHLLLSDMLGLMIRIGPFQTPEGPQDKIEDHRAQLVVCAEKVVRSIRFAELKEHRTVAPFFLAISFQMTITVLERECEILRTRGCDPAAVARYESMKELASQYMNWAMRNKISIKLDIALHVDKFRHFA